ncbi:MAG: choice-of-anchor J domain-containing protein, partial [bacterium]|nr:choice-of-anchor J domain-containing protein [bacterium]
DWVILPQETLGAPIFLTFWAASYSADYPENYEIRVSTTGTQPANFTNLIASVTDHPNPWTVHTHDLSAFANQPFYVAIHYVSQDEFVLMIDDVTLEGAEPNAVEDLPTLAREFAFHGNYPNPFNAQTQFSFALDRAGDVQLTLFNITGQEVARVVDGTMNAGTHVVPFDASSLPSGVYLAHLTANGHSATHKMMLLK